MPNRRSDKAIPLALAVGAYALALLQRPGLATSDTKIDLHVDPAGFLGRVASVWSPTGSLGHVQGGQYGGYLWPMGPFFAAGHAFGLSPWLVQRLWLGTLLALGAWGVVKLLDAMLGGQRGVAHVAAAILFTCNPYVVVFANRASFTLLGLAALPWLLWCVHRGLREPRRWWWPAAFALILTSTGGGVNAAVTAWLLPGPLLLVLYEGFAANVPWRSVRSFSLRTAAAAAAASVWWFAPEVVQSLWGTDFLRYTEQTGAIWGTTSLTESLRLMGYWPSYLGVGYGNVLHPYFGDSPTLLFDPPVVVATLIVPGLALGGFAWTRRWRYGSFFLALVLVGLLAMSVGFPPGTPLRRGADFGYAHLGLIRFLRTSNKAGPLVALGIACLGGAAVGLLWRSLRRTASATLARAVAVAAGAALVGLAALPLVRGDAVGLTWNRIPAAWTEAAHALDRDQPRNTRAAVLPGQPFAFYRFGGTVDPLLPSLTSRPVAVRNVPPYDDTHATDLLWTVDDMLHQRRLLPGQLAPLLDLMSAGTVVSGTDDDYGRSGGMPPAEAAADLAAQGLGRPWRSYGPIRLFRPAPGDLDAATRLPELRRYDRPAAPGIVRLEPAVAPTLVDGGASGLAGMAAFGDIRRGEPVLYAGDLSPARLREEASRAREIVIADGNRRQAYVASQPRQSVGWMLPANVDLPKDAAVLDPFASRGSDAQTVAAYRGARYVRAPFAPELAQFPEHRPYAAVDGDPRTSWLADPIEPANRHWIEVGLLHARDVPYIDLLPDDSNPRVAVTRVDVGGRTFAVHRGWNRLDVGLHETARVRVTITGQRTSGRNSGSAGGFRELRIPGVRVRELIRPPVLAERVLAGARGLGGVTFTYLFQRTTAADPFRRGPLVPPPPVHGDRAEAQAALIRATQDPDTSIDRTISPPLSRRWSLDGWATVAPAAPDPVLDRLAGAHLGGTVVTSSGRYQGRAGFRGSSALDGDHSTAWVAPGYGAPAWLAWHTPASATVRALRLAPPPFAALRPALVRVLADSGSTPLLQVGPNGVVSLPRPLRGRSFRLEVLRAVASGPRAIPAVGISDLAGPGVPRLSVPRNGPFRARCGALPGAVGVQRVALRPVGSVSALDAGAPLRVRGCGQPAIRLPAGPVQLHVGGGGAFRPYLLRMRSTAAPVPPVSSKAAGRVLSGGTPGRGRYDGIRLSVNAPSWLVLGESYSRGWTATCDGHSLGRPTPIDGFANGWRVGPDCHRAAFYFEPQHIVDLGYVVGGLACAGCLILLLLRRPRPTQAEPRAIHTDDSPWRLPARRAALAGLGVAAAVGFAFAVRAGAVAGPVAGLILWRGVGPRALALAAGALLAVVVPLLYVLFPGTDHGGYDTEYAVEHLGAHWVAVAAFLLLVLALARTVAAARRQPSSAPKYDSYQP